MDFKKYITDNKMLEDIKESDIEKFGKDISRKFDGIKLFNYTNKRPYINGVGKTSYDHYDAMKLLDDNRLEIMKFVQSHKFVKRNNITFTDNGEGNVIGITIPLSDVGIFMKEFSSRMKKLDKDELISAIRAL